MKRFVVCLLAFLYSLSAVGQDTFKLLVKGSGAGVVEAGESARENALEQCRAAFVPDSLKLDIGDVLAGEKVIRSSIAGDNAEKQVLYTVSVEKLASVLESNGVQAKSLYLKGLRLQRTNTVDCFEALYQELEALAPEIFDARAEFTPISERNRTVLTRSWSMNAATEHFCTILHNTIEALALSEEERDKALGAGLMVYETDYFLNVPEYDQTEGTATIKRNIRHYSRDLMNGFTYEDGALQVLAFLAPLDIKRMKKVFLTAVNSFRVKDSHGNVFITNLCDDFMDILFVDDFAKSITNIAFWNVSMEQKFGFEAQYGIPGFTLGEYSVAFYLPDYPDGEVTGTIERLAVASEQTASGQAPIIYQYRYDPSTWSYYKIYPRLD